MVRRCFSSLSLSLSLSLSRSALSASTMYVQYTHGLIYYTFSVPLLAIGSVLVVASVMSSCGLLYQECSVCIALSSKVLGWISLAELGLAVVMLTQGGRVDTFLRDHSNELELRSVRSISWSSTCGRQSVACSLTYLRWCIVCLVEMSWHDTSATSSTRRTRY